jgi:hypothetical protein
MGTNKNEESERERVLTDAELVAIWTAVPDNGYGRTCGRGWPPRRRS